METEKAKTTTMRVNPGCQCLADNGHWVNEGDSFETTDVARHAGKAQPASLPWPPQTSAPVVNPNEPVEASESIADSKKKKPFDVQTPEKPAE